MELVELGERGHGRLVLAEISPGGRCRVKESLLSLMQDAPDDLNRIVARVRQWQIDGDKGPPKKVWRYLRRKPPKIEEWKCGQQRVLWHQHDGWIVVSHVFKKQTEKTPIQEIDRAVAFAKRFLADSDAGQVHLRWWGE